MSKRAKQKALEAYPVQGMWVGNQYGEWDGDINRVYRNAFLRGYETAEKETIEKAVAWLESNVWEHTGLDHTELSDAFRQAMEEER